jgi:hypothetical protein
MADRWPAMTQICRNQWCAKARSQIWVAMYAAALGTEERGIAAQTWA